MSTETSLTHRLVESHRGYAHAIATDILKGLPSHVEKADIQSAAELGLTEAAATFDGRANVQFKTFAYYRIRGAVYDAIRKATWFSRAQYKELVAASAVNEYMTDASAVPQTPVGGVEELEAHVGSIVSCYMLSLESGKVEPPIDRQQSAEDRLLEKEWHSRLHQALARIPEKNRTVLTAYYFEERNLEEIGATLGLSKSWVCRLHAKGIEMLRDQLEKPADARGGATFAGSIR
ncbi:MAG: sigma-70 family RNA polymerase sigma factor [Candidatus Solibacter sp.]|nr:sigma-70 family RNA polymerase sigma factor [Candidatus Solibacter sp.]